MMSLSTASCSANGNVVLCRTMGSITKDIPARVTRIPTLDGGCVLIPSGVQDCDRTLKIRARLSASESDTLLAMYTGYTQFLLSTAEGVFFGAMQSFRGDNVDIKFDFLVKSKEA